MDAPAQNPRLTPRRCTLPLVAQQAIVGISQHSQSPFLNDPFIGLVVTLYFLKRKSCQIYNKSEFSELFPNDQYFYMLDLSLEKNMCQICPYGTIREKFWKLCPFFSTVYDHLLGNIIIIQVLKTVQRKLQR